MKSPLLWAGIIAIIALTTALIAPLFIDWNLYRNQIEAYGGEVTGRPVKIAGSISLRLLPAPVIAIENVTIGSGGAGTVANLLTVKLVEANLSLPALIRGQFSISEALLTEPVMTVERMTDGQVVLPISDKSRLDARMPVDDIALDNVAIRDGTMIVNDWHRDGHLRLEDVDLDLSAASLVGPYKINGSARHDGETWRIAAGTSRPQASGPIALTLRASPEREPALSYSFGGEVVPKDNATTALKGLVTIERVKAAAKGAGEAAKSDKSPDPVPMLIRADMAGDFDRLDLSKIEMAFGDRNDVARLIKGSAEVQLGKQIAVVATLESSRLALASMVNRPNIRFDRQAILDGLARLDGVFPRGVAVSLGFKTTFLELPGSTVENVSLIGDMDDQAIVVRRLEGIAPGHSDIALSGRFDRQREGFSGDVSVDTLDAGAGATWSGLDGSLFAAKGSPTALAFKAKIRVDRSGFALNDLNFQLDDATGTGSIAFAGGERRQWQVRLVADQFDSDRYLGADALKPEGGVGTWLLNSATQIKRVWLDGTDANLLLHVDHFRHRGIDATDLAIDVGLKADALDIKAFDIGNVSGARIETSGVINGLTTRPQGSLNARLDARDSVPFFTMIGLIDANSTTPLARMLSRLGPLDLSATIEAGQQDQQTTFALSLKGRAGTTAIQADGEYRGPVDTLGEEPFTLDATLSNPDVAGLLGQLPWTLPQPVKGGGAARITLTSSGRFGSDIKGSIEAALLNTQARMAVDIGKPEDKRPVSGTVIVTSAAPAMLVSALEIDTEAEAAQQPLSFKSTLGWKGGIFSLRDIEGALGANALRGSIAFGATPPSTIRGELAVSQLSLPWLLRMSLLGKNEADAAADVAEDLASKDWSEEPFALERLKSTGAELAIRAERGEIASGLSLDGLSFTLRAAGGKFGIADAKATLFGAPVSFSADAEPIGSEIKMSGRLALRGLPMAPILRTGAGEPALDGTLDLYTTFTGSGRSPAGLVASFAGNGQYSIRDGAVVGFDPAAFADAFGRVTSVDELDRAIETSLHGGRMAFSGGTAPVDIAEGVMRLAPIPIDNAAATGQVRSYFDLGGGTLDSAFDLQLTGIESAPKLELALSGPPSALSRTYDTAALRSDLTVKVLRESIEKLEALQREQEKQAREEDEARKRSEVKRAEEAARKAEEQRRAAEAAAKKAAQQQRAAEDARRQEDARQAAIAQKAAQEQAKREAEELARKAEEASRQRETPTLIPKVVPSSPPDVEVSPLPPPEDPWMEQPIPPDRIESPRPALKPRTDATPKRVPPQKAVTKTALPFTDPGPEIPRSVDQSSQGFLDPDRFTYSPK